MQIYLKKAPTQVFPVNIMKFVRTPILKNICERLLLQTSFVINLHDAYISTKIYGVHDGVQDLLCACFSKQTLYTRRINLGKKYIHVKIYTRYIFKICKIYKIYQIQIYFVYKKYNYFEKKQLKSWHTFWQAKLKKMERLYHVGSPT